MRPNKLRAFALMMASGGLLLGAGCGTIITDLLLQIGLSTVVSELLNSSGLLGT